MLVRQANAHSCQTITEPPPGEFPCGIARWMDSARAFYSSSQRIGSRTLVFRHRTAE